MGAWTIGIVGAGFAGSILARILSALGHHVVLLERGRHPRFTLGESSTPLAAICLERLARRYGLDDLDALAAYGRWTRRFPDLRRGLKRGFTFYAHRSGQEYANGRANESRLLVAASPDDSVADAHWLRADVDHYLARRAASEGVELLEEVSLESMEAIGRGWRLSGSRSGHPLRFDVDFVVDASGAGGFVPGQLGLAAAPAAPPGWSFPRTGLVYGHFADLTPFAEAADSARAEFEPGPYPDERAAVHHLTEEGWVYVLPFDDGVVSAGFVVDHDAAGVDWNELQGHGPEIAWGALLRRYPALARQFETARPIRPPGIIPLLQRRVERAVGERWALLPFTYGFLSPLYSTGIAWSLTAVERLARLFEDPAGGGAGADPAGASGTEFQESLGEGLSRYEALLSTEADHLARLIGQAYRLRTRFDDFVAWSFFYFAAASFSEAWQRLTDPLDVRGWTAIGFLGATDPALCRGMHEAREWLERRAETGSGNGGGTLEEVVRDRIATRDIAGLCDPARRRLYPVDLEPLVRNAEHIGLSPAECRARLPRLRIPA
jgi:FADH2 O2-dependent halogenase